jgi:UDP-N-acetyl-D-mannosaminuronic acid dehydrogenase
MASVDFTPREIVVIGTGYVGLPAALLLARAGHSVVGVDIDDNIVRAINEGVLHIKEERLQAVMDEPAVRQNLKAQSTPCEADVFLIAVPTPLDERKKVANLSIVVEATKSLTPHLREGNLVILESTVPPLTCRELMTPLLERSGLKVGTTLHLAHCPERILPGDVFYEIVHNDRIIGAADEKSRAMAAEVYASFVQGELLLTDDVTAELVKLMENAYRDVNIALANEFAAVARTLEIDPGEAIALANRHPRVNILKPGIGVGGHCIPIDPWFIKEVELANSRLIFTARLINDVMPARIAAHIRAAVLGI